VVDIPTPFCVHSAWSGTAPRARQPDKHAMANDIRISLMSPPFQKKCS
jgi:hypothetical protein